MHLVIWSSLRAGSHMLRSMLRADPLVVDVGEYLDPVRFGPFLDQKARDNPGRIIVSNPKWGLSPLPLGPRVRALQERGAHVILLYRRDLLAQQASFSLAAKTGAFRGAAQPGEMVTLTAEQTGPMMFKNALQLEQLRLLLKPLPHVELAYEDITVPAVAAAVTALIGMRLKVGEPTTTKSAPRLADYVTNLEDLI